MKKSKPSLTKKKQQPSAETGAAVLYETVAAILQEARSTAHRAVNFAMVQAYWHIGQAIVEEEQRGQERADYGQVLIDTLAQRLTKSFGKGFTATNLRYMRLFYQTFPIHHALRDELSWTHYRLLLRVNKEDARSFYLNESINSNWSTRELERQIDSLLFERLALSKDQKAVRQLADEGHIVSTPADLIKDPFVLEFLGLPDNSRVLERDLEQGLIDKLQAFLLELGKGFAFVARQKRITLDGDHFHVDLVFYNYLLKCFVLLDLKTARLTHGDIGQMDFYVRYFEQEEKGEGDNPTIGLILCADKNEAMVKYTLLNESQQIFAAKYQFYLPTEEELRRELTQERARWETEHKLADLAVETNDE